MIKDLKLDIAFQTAKLDETASRDTGKLHWHRMIRAVLVRSHRSTSFIAARRKTKECGIRERIPTCGTGVMGEVTFKMTVGSRMKHVAGVAN